MDARRTSPPDPRRAARRELARAVAGLAGNFAGLADFAFTRDSYARAITQDLAGFAPAIEEPALPDLPARPLRVFVACAEASGEIHGANLARRLRALAAARGAPAPELFGFGGARLRDAGVETLAEPGARAAMLGGGVLAALPYYVDLLEQAGQLFRDRSPDVFVPVDSPALHVPMARIARRYGRRVVHFIAPQLWAWAPWRARAYGAAVDLALTILPFEPAWFARHGVVTAHVGHPLLDQLAALPPPPPPDARAALALLPGSRRGEIRLNLPWMLGALDELRAAQPGLDVVVAQATEEHAELVRSLVPESAGVRLAFGNLHAELAGARAALAVSGTVLTDLLHHRIPAVVVYRVGSRWKALGRGLLTTPWFASTNLIAGAAVLPEYLLGGDAPRAEVGRALLRCYKDDRWRAGCLSGLERAARRLGPPGATERAAVHVLRAACARP
jgi:lipid-A-disaccharide synthase